MDKEANIQLNTVQPEINNEIMSFAATGMDLEIIVLSEVNQKERQMLYAINCMWI